MSYIYLLIILSIFNRFLHTKYILIVRQIYILLQIETLSADLTSAKKKCEEFEVEFSRVQDELVTLRNVKNNIEETLTDKVHNLEEQLDEVSLQIACLNKSYYYYIGDVYEICLIINNRCLIYILI